MKKKRLLVVAHAPSDNTQALLSAVLRGAQHEDFTELETISIPPLQAGSGDVLGADAIVLGTTENFGYMSGALKDFFDRIYYQCIERTEAMPYALYIRAGKDGTGTRRAVEAIASGLRWKQIRPPLILQGEYQDRFREECEELGMYAAAGLDAGLF